ncbi:helix-turn-helix domain-containing protein [Gynuella sunshinyii]|uniref:Response regulator containing a CheY-like receiver domain and an HTH DNA-binding domain n=1 Tax=Gynuella sunshinyii YC6258 TaxID=1445510 RepID=A0A0C5W503_9GAMM|nr:helix-turn-helix transcriptional regulator [Gynuella sunshinyii]AJQ97684.1 response regulator containing a CheY-like receiver domain and an HTH DNA-binding domain [Gynuella sunshinyii YC6258]
MISTIYESLPDVIQSIGRQDFYHQIVHALSKVGVTSTRIFDYSLEQEPVLIHGEQNGKTAELDEEYCTEAYRLDPFFNAIKRRVATGIYTLESVTRHNFKDSDYYQRFYRKVGWQNETNLIVNYEAGKAISISFTFAQDEPILLRQEFTTYFHSLNAAVYQHNILPGRTVNALETNTVMADQNPCDYENYGLTRREAEIVQLILEGNPSPIIAQKCFVSNGTVKNHRKNIYRKLGIKSQCELFHKFMQ